MDRVSVQSSNVASIGWDSDTQTLEIEFLSGSIYQYRDVPKDVYEALIGASSVGGFFASNIKNEYRFYKVH